MEYLFSIGLAIVVYMLGDVIKRLRIMEEKLSSIKLAANDAVKISFEIAEKTRTIEFIKMDIESLKERESDHHLRVYGLLQSIRSRLHNPRNPD